MQNVCKSKDLRYTRRRTRFYPIAPKGSIEERQPGSTWPKPFLDFKNGILLTPTC
jgi:hypothetical protein